jgi:hypothetical protein
MVEHLAVQPTFTKQPGTLLLSPFAKSTFLAGLAEGQVLEAKVMRDFGGHTLLISVNGATAVAKCTIPLKTEQQVQVLVTATRPQVVMKLIGEAMQGEDALTTLRLMPGPPLMAAGALEQKALSLIRTYLPLHINWGALVQDLKVLLGDAALSRLEVAVDTNLLQKVASTLSRLSFDENNAGDGTWLKQFIEHAGLLYESKLTHLLLEEKGAPYSRQAIDGDLKGLLLDLSQKLRDAAQRAAGNSDGAPGSNAKQLLDAVTASIKQIELHQLLNCVTARSDQQLIFQIPLMLPEGITTAELYVRTGRGSKKGKSARDNVYIVFLLTMRSLGPLRIDAHIMKKKVRCTIRAGNKEIADFVKHHASELVRRFASLDYQVEQLSCEVTKGDTQEAREPIALKGFSLLTMKLLDITV